MKEEAASKKLYQERIAQLFRAQRKQCRFSQKKLSEKLSISQGFLSKIEAGVSSPDIVVWLGFCREFRISPNLILNDRDFEDYLDEIDPEGTLRERPAPLNVETEENEEAEVEDLEDQPSMSEQQA